MSDRCLLTSVDTANGRRNQQHEAKMYQFTQIFGTESNQKEIFENVVKENLKKLPEGFNFTLMSYGASGSGKTYTLMGTVAAPGLVPRSLEYVFRVVEAAQYPLFKPADNGFETLDAHCQNIELQWVQKLRQVSLPQRDQYQQMSIQPRNEAVSSSSSTRYYVWVSFVEIYMEAIYDLLTNSDRSKETSKLPIREDSKGNAYVKGARQAFVRSGEEAYGVLVAGKHNLHVAATGVHAQSSRSHCIFTITLLTQTAGRVRSSFVRMCDLAGSERARQTRNTGARMQESCAINSSLHVLERCLHTLRQKQRMKDDTIIVPYRESKLTRLLGAGLSGARGEAVSMVVTLNPAPQYAQEMRHVLQLAAVAKDIQIHQTMAETPAEMSQENSEDTTVECSDEASRWRNEAERLRYELERSESRVKKVKSKLEAMHEQMEEMKEELTRGMEEAERSASTPSCSSWQNKAVQPMPPKRVAGITAVEQIRQCLKEERDEGSSSVSADSDSGYDGKGSLGRTFKHSAYKKKKDPSDIVLIEKQAKTERKIYVKRNFGLRQRKYKSDGEKSDQEKNVKLKDVVNLQVEYSDITLDKPAAIKDVKDIASPEKEAGKENLPPMYEVQSCSLKNVPRRSPRLKLRQPRAEPPEESPEGSAGVSDDRVPRPLNHKPRRARRRPPQSHNIMPFDY